MCEWTYIRISFDCWNLVGSKRYNWKRERNVSSRSIAATSPVLHLLPNQFKYVCVYLVVWYNKMCIEWNFARFCSVIDTKIGTSNEITTWNEHGSFLICMRNLKISWAATNIGEIPQIVQCVCCRINQIFLWCEWWVITGDRTLLSLSTISLH